MDPNFPRPSPGDVPPAPHPSEPPSQGDLPPGGGYPGYGSAYPQGYGYYGNGYGGYGGGYGYGSGTPEFLSPRRLLKTLRRRWFLIFFLTGLGAAAAYVYFTKAEPVYRSEAKIEMTVRGPQINQDVVSQDLGKREEVFNTRLERLRGPSFEKIAAEEFARNWAKEVEAGSLSGPVPELPEISYSLIRLSSLVKVTAEANEPNLAALAANSAANAAEAFFQMENQEMSDNAVEWLQRQSVLQLEAVERMDAELMGYRSKNQVETLNYEQEAERQTLLKLNEMRVEQATQLLQAREFLNSINQLDTDSIDLQGGVELPSSLPNQESILEEARLYRDTVAEKEVLLQKYTERHPSVVELSRRISDLGDSIRLEIRMARSSFLQQIKMLEDQQNAVDVEIQKTTERVTERGEKIVETEGKLKALEEKRAIANGEYKETLQRMSVARQAADEETATLKVVEPALAAMFPVHPRFLLLLPLGVIGGMGLGLLLALLLEALEDRIFSVSELEESLSSRIIGVIPHVPGRKRPDMGLISMNQKFGQVTEAFNAVRVLLDHVNAKRIKELEQQGRLPAGAHVVMFCSASPSEGKTINSANVGVTSARAGQRTLLIDGDMRRPRLASVFAEALQEFETHPEEKSLLHHLSRKGGKQFEDVIIPGPVENLELMTSLPSSDINPSDLLGGEDFKALIHWARQHYDRVIVDTPPIGVISDGLVIAGLSDGVVVICRSGQTRHRALRHVMMQFKGVGAEVHGIIVNDFNVKRAADSQDLHYREFSSDYHKSYAKKA